MLAIIGQMLRNRRGGTAASFALLLPVMVSGMGLAIDYSHYRLVQTRLQVAVDAAALSAIGDLSVGEAGMVGTAVNTVAINLPDDYGQATRSADVTIGTYSAENGFVPLAEASPGATANAARVTAIRSPARGNVVQRIFSVFISREALTVSATAIAARPGNVFYEPPEVKTLDSDAWDFNELYAYCYDYANNQRVPNTETLISNNARPTNVTAIYANGRVAPVEGEWPECSGEGQSLSFHLSNFREANQIPDRLRGATPIPYYTDTVITNGIETRATDGENILETRLCDTASKCDPLGADSEIVKGSNRTPNRELRPCEPGKFMYFGWEDRPPSGGSDQDFNDITIQLRCPRNGKLGDDAPRLVS